MAFEDEEYGLRIDCEKQGCVPKHSDDGEVVPTSMGDRTTVGGHAATRVTRTVTYGDWEEANDG